MYSLLLVCTLSAILAGYILYQRFFSPLAAVPGPFNASLSRYWIVKATRSGQLHRILIDLHDHYGPLVRIAPDEVSVADLEAFKKIYGAGSKFPKAKWYNVLQGGRKFDLFAEQDESVHSSQRRLVSRVYTLENLKSLEPYVNGTISRFMEKMRSLCGVEIDMGRWLQLFAFDVIGEVTFSQPFGFMDAHIDDGIFDRIQRSVKSGAWLGHVPWLYQLHNFFMPVFGNHLAINDREGTLRDYTIREVQNRLNRGSDRLDILGRLFEIHHEKPSSMDMISITSVAAANVGAGSDTTAISLRAILYFLLQNPDKLAKLKEEIDINVAQNNESNIFTFERSMKMPYLQAVIYEGIRLYPSIGSNLPRVTPPGGLMIGKTFIPAGTIVGSSAWVINRNKEIYGKDSAEFRPERWLGNDVGDLQRYFFSFGGGSRTCIGRNISWLEISKLIPTLLQEFDMRLLRPDIPLREDCSFFVPQSGFYVELEPLIALRKNQN